MLVCVAGPLLQRCFFSWRSLSGHNVAEEGTAAGSGVVTLAVLAVAMLAGLAAATSLDSAGGMSVVSAALMQVDSPDVGGPSRPRQPDAAFLHAIPSCATGSTFAFALALAASTTTVGASPAAIGRGDGVGVGLGRGVRGGGMTIRRLGTMTTTRIWRPPPR